MLPAVSASSPRANRKRSPSAAPIRALKGKVLVTRRVHFNAAHRLDNPGFDAAWNQRTYGVDLGQLKSLLEAVIVARCDHRNLNVEVDFLQGIIPSTENLVIAFWNEIAPRLKAGTLHRVRLYESERNFAEYCGPDAFAEQRS